MREEEDNSYRNKELSVVTRLSDETEAMQNNDNQEKIKLSNTSRWIVYTLFLTSNALISMDHGSIPASTEQLRSVISYDQGIGLFGSLVYVGNIIGSIFIFKIINTYNRKTLLMISLLINAACLFTFVVIDNLIFMFLNRVVVGIFQAYLTIYMPVWCNQFGEKTKRTLMIAFIQLVSPIGVFLGYTLAAVSIQEKLWGGWKFAFVIQSFLIIGLITIVAFVPQIYFDKNLFSVTDSLGVESFTYINEAHGNNQQTSRTDDMPIKEMFQRILRKKIFVFSVLGLSVLIYVISGVQYWISDYMMNILLVKSAKMRLFFFTLVCFTSPTFGVLAGTFTKNIICRNDMTKSLYFTSTLGFLATIFAIMVPLVLSWTKFFICMWLVLFFGGGIVPVITNIIVTSVPKKLSASGNSITNFMCNLCGYLPAPYIYGILSDIFYDKGVAGMKFTMWYSVLGMIFFFIATYESVQKDKRVNI